MKILSIETSCDETALSLIDANGGLETPRFKILKNLVASQIKIHQPFGGVVPNLAKREHLKNLPILFEEIKDSMKSVDLIAVTAGPGLEPCLWAGIEFAKNLAKKSKKPLVGVNHLEGHLYSFLLSQKTVNSELKIKNSELFPAIALIVSGGHTILLLMKDLTHYKKLGETRDDAAGEAFDKVARLLKLPYPGGPQLEKLAALGNPEAIPFPRPMLDQKNYDFSFSGLKTAVLYYLRENARPSAADIAASFQQAVIDVLIKKPISAAEIFRAKSILLSGGVANNKALRQNFEKEAEKNKIKFFAPAFEFTTDNAAMTAVAAYFNRLKKKNHHLIAQGHLNI
jgi:N6-L-threonylcarbamoyladenine synthase